MSDLTVREPTLPVAPATKTTLSSLELTFSVVASIGEELALVAPRKHTIAHLIYRNKEFFLEDGLNMNM